MNDLYLDSTTEAFIIDVYTLGYEKQGESIYISLKTNNEQFFYDILIDSYKTYKNRTIELLDSIKKNNYINCICLSHYHDDHIMGFGEIIDKYSKRDTDILIPDVDCQESLSNEATSIRNKIACLRKNGKRNYGSIHKISDPMIILNNSIYIENRKFDFEVLALSPLSNVTIRNVGKNAKDIEQNDYTISLIIKLGEVKLLFTGDIMNNTLSLIKNIEDMNYIKIPHHGSMDSNKLLDIININKNTVCVTTNYKPSNLPNESLLNKYVDRTDDVYITRDNSQDDYGIVHTRYKINLENNELLFDTECLKNSRRYIKEQIWDM